MKLKYCIGFISAIFILTLLIGIGSQLSYEYALEKKEAKIEENRKIEESVTTKGAAKKNTGYYLVERNGYVLVCLSDRSTIYEYTDILVEELPDSVQDEVKRGKYIETTQELYGFLENYSS